jgi:hypothetical protein
MAAFKPPGQCPACGEWVPRGAAACDDCGACAKSGWKADADVYDDLPDDNFDYDDFIEREFARLASNRRPGISRETFWRIVAAILFATLVMGYLLSARAAG